MRKLFAALAATLALGLSGCGYNTFQTTDEQVKAAWSEVVSQYQRRADLIQYCSLTNCHCGLDPQSMDAGSSPA